MWTKSPPRMSGFFPRGGPRPGPLSGMPRSPMFGPQRGGPRSPPFPGFYPPGQPYFRGAGQRPGPNRGGMGHQLNNGYSNGYHGNGNGYANNGYANGYVNNGGFDRRPPHPPLFAAPPGGGGYGGGPGGGRGAPRARGRGGFAANRTASAGRKRKRGAANAAAGVTVKTEDATSGGDSENQAKVPKKEKEFFCDTCERGFDTRDKLDEHYGTHYHCEKPGCTFEAHPKIVELHVQMQHNTGFAEKIMALNSAEQIEKWREERKKKFPSAEAVARRQAEQEAKIARGELLTNLAYYTPQAKRGQQPRGGGTAADSVSRGRGRGGRSRGGVPWMPRGRGMDHPNFRPPMAPFPGSYPPPLMRGRMFFRGGRTSHFLGRSGFAAGGRGRGGGAARGRGGSKAKGGQAATKLGKFGGTTKASQEVAAGKVKTEPMDTSETAHITDSEGEAVAPSAGAAVTTSTRKKCKDAGRRADAAMPAALLSLMAAYDSDDSDSQTPPSAVVADCSATTSAAVPEHQPEPATKATGQTNARRNRKRAGRRRGGRASQRQSDEPEQSQHPARKHNAPAQKKRATLLERLLANEIRHERNVILQCVHHVVAQNFFGIGQGKAAGPSTEAQNRTTSAAALDDADGVRKQKVILQCVRHLVRENFFGVAQSDIVGDNAPAPVNQESPHLPSLQEQVQALSLDQSQIADQPVSLDHSESVNVT